MKKTSMLIACIIAVLLSSAQNNSFSDPAKQYLFENFSKGIVLMKTGAVEEASLNYNTADQSIIFEKDGRILTLTGLETVDTIYFKNKRFIPGPDGLMYEIIVSNPPAVALYVTYTNKLRPATAVANQAGTTHQESAATSNTVSSVYVLRPYSGDYMVEIQKTYWLIKAKQIYKANSVKQFQKVFPHKDEAIRNYVKEKQVNFNVETDLVNLTSFCNNS